MNSSPKLTVITVCRNEPNIEETCKSIVSQTWQDFEWIVVDGASTDGTLDILEKYKDRIDIFVSEPDSGIYDAMNKGIRLAHGEFLNFMNGGDSFADIDVLKKVFSSGTEAYSKYGVLYGDVFVSQGGHLRYQSFPREYPLSKFTEERWSVNHQSAFIRSSLFREYGEYDVRFKINADFHRFVQWRKHGVRFFHLEIVVAIFDLAGLSQQNRVANDAEKESAISLHFPGKKRRKVRKLNKLIWRGLLFNKIELFRFSENHTRTKEIFSLLGIPVLGFQIKREFNAPAQMTTNALWRGLQETLVKEGQIFGDLAFRVGKLKDLSLPATSLHQEIFPKYRNCHAGKDVVIVGAGPTLDDYEPIPGAIHIGVNKTFLCEKLQLDYLFIQDYFEDIQDAADVYRPNDCKKFYGYHFHGLVRGIPALSAERANAERYFFEDVPVNDPSPFPFPPDISRACLGTFSSIIFPALQFALWTHPKRIYLVGCDCSSLGHCGGITSKTSAKMKLPLATERLLYGWQRMKDFIEKFYPDIEVISINPVGLKGMFVDMERTTENA